LLIVLLADAAQNGIRTNTVQAAPYAQELVTMDELLSRLRADGVERPADAKRSFMGSGRRY